MIARGLVLALALGLPAAAYADPISLIMGVIGITGASTFTAALGVLTGWAVTAIAVGSSLYGGMAARRRAKHAAEDARRAYNAGLQDRMVTAVQQEPALRAIYGECRVGGDIVAVLTSDKTGARADGTAYTKPDALKHLVIVLAAHEVEDIVEMYIDGEPVGAVDVDGWATTGDAAKVRTVRQRVTIAAGASHTFPAAVTVLDASDPAGYYVTWDYSSWTWVGTVVSYTQTNAGKTINNTSAISAVFDVSITLAPGSVRWSKHLGTASQTADSYLLSTVPADWTADDRLRGLAYVVVTLDVEDQRFQGGPPQLTWQVKGRKLYDPRTATTAWSANPALVVRDYLMAPWGLECAAGEIDDETVKTAADDCDYPITLDVDGTLSYNQPRYTCNGMVTSSDARERVLDALADAMAGDAVYGAKWEVHAGVWRAPVLSLGDGDLVGQIEVAQAGAGLDEVCNGVRGSYVPAGDGAASDFQYQNATFVAADGRELWVDASLPYTDDPARARNIARIKVEQARDSQVLRVPASLKAWPLQFGDRVTLTNTEYGLSAKTYRVTDWQFGLQTPVMLTLQEDIAAIYDLADAASADPAPNTMLPNLWAIAPVTGVVASSGNAHAVLRPDGSVNVRVLVSWDPYAGPNVIDGGAIEVRWQRPRPRKVGSTVYPGDSPDHWTVVRVAGNATSAYIDGVAAGEALLIAVVAVGSLGQDSQAVILAHTVGGKTAAPINVAGFGGTANTGGVLWTWQRPDEADYACTEIRSADSDWGAASPAAIYRGAATRYFEPVATPGTITRYARHVDRYGNVSASAASDSVAMTAADVFGDLAVLDQVDTPEIVPRAVSNQRGGSVSTTLTISGGGGYPSFPSGIGTQKASGVVTVVSSSSPPMVPQDAVYSAIFAGSVTAALKTPLPATGNGWDLYVSYRLRVKDSDGSYLYGPTMKQRAPLYITASDEYTAQVTTVRTELAAKNLVELAIDFLDVSILRRAYETSTFGTLEALDTVSVAGNGTILINLV